MGLLHYFKNLSADIIHPMPKYGLATILEDYPVGYEFTGENIPLHLTHVDSFVVDLSTEELAAKLQSALSKQQSFSVTALKDELYGTDKDIPVTVLELSPELQALHIKIMDMLQSEGALLKNPQFHGEGFKPHVSIYGTRRIAIGDDILIKDVSIAAKLSEEEDATRQILATVSFEGL